MIGGSLTAVIVGTLVPELICIMQLIGKKIATAILAEIVERAIVRELSKRK